MGLEKRKPRRLPICRTGLSLVVAFFTLSFLLGISGASPTLPSNTFCYVPITITNGQNEGILANTPIPLGTTSSGNIVGIPASSYKSCEASSLDNVEFAYNNGTVATTWFEGNVLNEQQTTNLYTSSNALWWLLVPGSNFLKASSSNTLNMIFLTNTINAFNGVTVGEAPQLSNNYGQYDDGANVFMLYADFKGTSCPSKFTCSGTYTISNGITVTNGYAASNLGYMSTSNAATYNNIAESYITANNLDNMNTGGSFFGFTDQPGAQYGTANNWYGFVGDELGDNVFQSACPGGQFCSLDNRGDNADPSLAQNTLGVVGVGALPFEPYVCSGGDSSDLYVVNYNNCGSTQDPVPTSVGNVIISSYPDTGGVGNMPITAYWVRVRRQAPVNDIEPGTSYGSETVVPFTATITNPSNAVADVGQYETFTVNIVNGTGPYTANVNVVNSISLSVIAHNSLVSVSSASNAFTFQLTGADTSNSPEKANVIVTDVSGRTTNSVYTSTFTINALPTITLSPSTNTIEAGQSVKFTNVTMGGTGPFTYSYAVNALSGYTVSGNAITFTSTGTYNVLETVTDNLGSSASSSNSVITVNPGVSLISFTSANSFVYEAGYQTLTAVVSGGTSPYTYNFVVNGPDFQANSLVSNAFTSNSFTFEVSDFLTGTYTANVYVTDADSSKVSNSITFNVISPLSAGPILPQTRTIDAGQSVTLTAVSGGGEVPISYQWYIGTACNSIISGATSNTYPATFYSTSSVFTYRVTDNLGETACSSPDTITVNADPSISLGFSNTTLDAGQTETITASISGGTPGYLFNIYNVTGGDVLSAETYDGWFRSVNYPINASSNECSFDPQNNGIYCVTGLLNASGGPLITTNSVYLTQPVANGTIGNWQSLTNYPVNMINENSCFTLSNSIYCISGDTNAALSVTTSNSYYANILTNNQLSSWSLAGNSFSMSLGSCRYSSGYVYCVAGLTSGNVVYSAPISGGTIGAFTEQGNYPFAVSQQPCDAYNNNLYCFAGNGATSAVYYASTASGTVGAWTQTTSLPLDLIGQQCFMSELSFGNYSFCLNGAVGGGTLTFTSNTYYAQITGNSIGTWIQSESYPLIHDAYGCGFDNNTNFVYCFGGAKCLVISTCAGDAANKTDLAYFASISQNGYSNSLTYTFTANTNTQNNVFQFNGIIYDSAAGGLSNSFVTNSVASSITVDLALSASAPTSSSSKIDSGQSTTLTANPSNGAPPYSYKWYTVSGPASPTCTPANVISGATSSTYVASPTTENSYAYQVTDSASTPVSACSTAVAIAVEPALSQLIVTDNSVIDPNQNESITAVSAQGTSPYSYNTQIFNPSGQLIYSNGTWSVATVLANGLETLYYTPTIAPSNVVRGDLLLNIFSTISNGTSVYLKPGVYDLQGHYIDFSTRNGISLLGSGKNTVIKSTYGVGWKMPTIDLSPSVGYGVINPGTNSVISDLEVNGSPSKSTDFALDAEDSLTYDPYLITHPETTSIKNVYMSGWAGIYQYESYNSGFAVYNSTINSTFMGIFAENGKLSGVFDSNIVVTGTNAMGIRHNECGYTGVCTTLTGNEIFDVVNTLVATYSTVSKTHTSNGWSMNMSWGVLNEGNGNATNIYGGKITTGGANALGENMWDLYYAAGEPYEIMVNSTASYNAMRISAGSTHNCPATGTYNSILGICTTTSAYGPYPYSTAPTLLGYVYGDQILQIPNVSASGTWTVNSVVTDNATAQSQNSITFLVNKAVTNPILTPVNPTFGLTQDIIESAAWEYGQSPYTVNWTLSRAPAGFTYNGANAIMDGSLIYPNLSITTNGIGDKLWLCVAALNSDQGDDVFQSFSYSNDLTQDSTVVQMGHQSSNDCYSVMNTDGGIADPDAMASVAIGVQNTTPITYYNKTINDTGGPSTRAYLRYQVTNKRNLVVLLVGCGAGNCDSSGGSISAPNGCVLRDLQDNDGYETAALYTCANQSAGTYSFNALNDQGQTIGLAAYVLSSTYGSGTYSVSSTSNTLSLPANTLGSFTLGANVTDAFSQEETNSTNVTVISTTTSTTTTSTSTTSTTTIPSSPGTGGLPPQTTVQPTTTVQEFTTTQPTTTMLQTQTVNITVGSANRTSQECNGKSKEYNFNYPSIQSTFTVNPDTANCFTVSAINITSAKTIPNSNLTAILEVNFTLSTGNASVTATLHYKCGIPSNRVAPFILTKGKWEPITPFSVNPAACTVSFAVPADPIIGLFEIAPPVSKTTASTTATSTTTIPQTTTHQSDTVTILIVIAAIVLIMVVAYLLARRRRRGYARPEDASPRQI